MSAKEFTEDELGEMFLNNTIYDFSVDHSAIEKENMLNIHEYLMA